MATLDIKEQLKNISISSIPDTDFSDGLIEQLIVQDVFVNKRNLCIIGPGGTGKSHIAVNEIKRRADQRGIHIALTSTTGVSALSIGGTTIHRWTGIKLGKEALLTIVSRIKYYNKDCLKRWKECKIMIVDEISMLGLKTFELIDRVGRCIREEDDIPFGGMQMIFFGDFLQLPPVGDDFAFKSDVWDELNLKYYYLTTPRRYKCIDHFNLLLRARIGEYTPEDIKKLNERVQAYIDYIGSGQEKKEDIKPTRIFPLKNNVEKHNLDELARLPGISIGYNSIDKFVIKKGKNGNPELKDKEKELSTKEVTEYTEFLDTLVPRRLFFKPGAQVMLTCNLSTDLGLVNGSRGVVKSCEQDGITVSFKNGITTKIAFRPNDHEDGKVKMVRFQVPLILAWAISIHKAQGVSLDYAIMDLGPSIFAPGMAYVSLSRVRTLEGLYLSGFIPSKLYADRDALEFDNMVKDQSLMNITKENEKKEINEEEVEEVESSDEIEIEESDDSEESDDELIIDV